METHNSEGFVLCPNSKSLEIAIGVDRIRELEANLQYHKVEPPKVTLVTYGKMGKRPRGVLNSGKMEAMRLSTPRTTVAQHWLEQRVIMCRITYQCRAGFSQTESKRDATTNI